MRLAEALATNREAPDAAAIREVIGRLGLEVNVDHAIALCTGHRLPTVETAASTPVTDVPPPYRPVVTTSLMERVD